MLAVILAVAVLYLGRDILMPLSLALLASFAIARPVAFVEKRGLGRPWAVGLVSGALVVLLVGAGLMAWTQLSGALDELPNYSAAIKEKVGALLRRFAALQAAGETLVTEATGGSPQIVEIGSAAAPSIAGGAPPVQPLPAAPIPPGPSLLRQVPAAVGWVMGPLGTFGMIMLFAVFMLLYREDLRNRFIRLIGHDDLTGTTLALADASQRIGRYLGMQVLINSASGIVVASGLLLLGIPGWALCGCLYALLRFLPYVGPIMGVAIPVAIALAVAPGWWLCLGTLAFFLVIEAIINLLVEPRLYGGSTGVSSFAVLVAAAFWTWLWGPIGLLLAMPLTVVIVVLGKSVRQLGFLRVLFGTDEVLSPGDRYYQRVIASDVDEAMRIMEEAAVDDEVGDVYEKLIVPGLAAAERDRQAGRLTAAEYAAACENIRDSLEDMELRHASAGAGTGPAAASGRAAAGERAGHDPERQPTGVVCLPVVGGANDVAAAVLDSLLRRAGHPSRRLSADLTLGERLGCIGETETVCIVSLPDPTFRMVRATCKRLKEQRPLARVVVMVWGASVDASVWRYRSLLDLADAVVTRLRDLLPAVSLERPTLVEGVREPAAIAMTKGSPVA